MIPMAALVAIMIMVSINTFDWSSIAAMRVMPLTETIVMLATMLTVIITHNLAYGVFAGVILACIFFARQVAKSSKVKSQLDESGTVRTYSVKGPLYFVSTEDFVNGFDMSEKVDEVNIDLSEAQVWDASAIAAIDKVVLRYRKHGIEANVLGMNKHSQKIHDELATHTDPNAKASLH